MSLPPAKAALVSILFVNPGLKAWATLIRPYADDHVAHLECGRSFGVRRQSAVATALSIVSLSVGRGTKGEGVARLVTAHPNPLPAGEGIRRITAPSTTHPLPRV